MSDVAVDLSMRHSFILYLYVIGQNRHDGKLLSQKQRCKVTKCLIDSPLSVVEPLLPIDSMS